MASLHEVQQQLMASHDQVRALSGEVANLTRRMTEAIAEFDRKANYLNDASNAKDVKIDELTKQVAALSAENDPNKHNRGDRGGRGGRGGRGVA